MIPTTWLTLAQGLWLQTICAASMVYITLNTDSYTCDLKESIRRTAKHRFDDRDLMFKEQR